jgi:hypothetical protein
VCASVFFRFLLWVVGSDLVCCRSVRYLVSSEQPTGRIFFFFFLYLMPIGFLPFSTKTGWTGKKKNQIYDSISFFLMCTTTKYGEFHSELGGSISSFVRWPSTQSSFQQHIGHDELHKNENPNQKVVYSFLGKCRWLESPGCWTNVEKSIDGWFFLIPYKRMRLSVVPSPSTSI